MSSECDPDHDPGEGNLLRGVGSVSGLARSSPTPGDDRGPCSALRSAGAAGSSWDTKAPGPCRRTLESGSGPARSQNPPDDAGPVSAARTCCVNAIRDAGGFRSRETRVWCARRVSRSCPGIGWIKTRQKRLRCWPPRKGATRKDSLSFALGWCWRRSSIGTPWADGRWPRGVPDAENAVPGPAAGDPAERESRERRRVGCVASQRWSE